MSSYVSAAVRVIQAMKGRLDEPFSLKSMAKVAYASPYHFNRAFRRITGIPPGQYLWALRLEAATRRLTATEDSVLDVCYDVGYNSLGTFTRRFTELLGVPPARYRALSRQTDEHACLDQALRHSDPSTEPGDNEHQGEIEGWIDYPDEFSGPTAIGLFTDSLPQGRPVACCFATAPGAFRLTQVPDGTFYLFALGIASGQSLFDTEAMLRGGGNRVVVKNSKSTEIQQIQLRAPMSTDPPILLALPVLLRQTAQRSSNSEAAKAPLETRPLTMQAHG
jgi:AraC-like DNA-binding protein